MGYLTIGPSVPFCKAVEPPCVEFLLEHREHGLHYPLLVDTTSCCKVGPSAKLLGVPAIPQEECGPKIGLLGLGVYRALKASVSVRVLPRKQNQ